MCGGAVITGGLSEPCASIVYVAGRRASVGGGAVGVVGVRAPAVVVLGGAVVELGGVAEVVLTDVGGDVSGAVGGAPVAVSGGVRVVVWAVVEELATVDELPPDPDPPHPAAVKSRAAPRRTAVRLTFAG